MSPMGKKKCSYKPMQKKGLIAPPATVMGEVKKPKYTTVKNEDGTETNTYQKTNRKGKVKKTVISLVGTDSHGDKVMIASVKKKPGKPNKTSGNKEAVADIENSLNKSLAGS